jgi:hypothetical protein
MASPETIRSLPSNPLTPARPGAPPRSTQRDERARQTTPAESLEPHWAAAIDAATD